MFKSIKSRTKSSIGLLLAASVAVGVGMTAMQSGQPGQNGPAGQDAAPSPPAEQPATTVRVGTYNPESTLQRYHRVDELVELQQELQPQAQQAAEAGDQQRLMELQSQMQEAQMRILEAFEADMAVVVPEIARKNGLQLIALQVVFSEPGIEPQDVTEEIVEAINANAPAEDAPADVDPVTPQPADPTEAPEPAPSPTPTPAPAPDAP